jgi:hypothetical protein
MTLDQLMKDSGFLISMFETMRDGLIIVDKERMGISCSSTAQPRT